MKKFSYNDVQATTSHKGKTQCSWMDRLQARMDSPKTKARKMPHKVESQHKVSFYKAKPGRIKA
jgi:hypothetical protein